MTQPRPDATRAEVPGLVGRTVPMAIALGHDAGLVVTAADLDGPPLTVLAWPGVWVVTAQEPGPGTLLRRGSIVVVEFQKEADA
ncbi:MULTISPECIES: PASTA domain-containing protein [Actinoalloteichus]|uniref:PASTA domain-containing protein n=1 Tax=Actinoalloteichus fjordicus TaxID=1612552 RepID=A0AAC9PT45_9PSEU|nr:MULTISPECIES: PASTA domain-containing protein [Actinoalloteichus]APU15758.1 hypothetical protein UA74_18650 [Actinoalloteichus fjordicus]APU21818.1 hypothetical protein UA75_19140 [Actinoalloteichus sp. GBA129-24]